MSQTTTIKSSRPTGRWPVTRRRVRSVCPSWPSSKRFNRCRIFSLFLKIFLQVFGHLRKLWTTRCVFAMLRSSLCSAALELVSVQMLKPRVCDDDDASCVSCRSGWWRRVWRVCSPSPCRCFLWSQSECRRSTPTTLPGVSIEFLPCK